MPNANKSKPHGFIFGKTSAKRDRNSKLENPSGKENHGNRGRDFDDKGVAEGKRIFERDEGGSAVSGRLLGGHGFIYVVVGDNAETFDNFQYWIGNGYLEEKDAENALLDMGFSRDRYGSGYSRIVPCNSMERRSSLCNKYSGLQKAHIEKVALVYDGKK